MRNLALTIAVVVIAGLAVCPTPCRADGGQARRRSALVGAAAGAGIVAQVTIDSAVYPQPNTAGESFRTVRKGSTVRIVEVRQEWCRVEFDDPELGPRVGYVRGRLRHRGAPREQGTEYFISAAIPAQADRAWIAVDGAGFPYAERYGTHYSVTPVTGGTLVSGVEYPAWAGIAAGVHVSAGVGLRRGFGVEGGLHTATKNRQVSGWFTVPSPAPPYWASVSGGAGPFVERRERAIDISAAYTTPTPDLVRVRLLAGPTLFSVSDQRIASLNYTQILDATPSLATLRETSFNVQDVSASALGFHVGIDVSVFFSRHVGLGGIAWFSRGRVSIEDPLSGLSDDLRVGQVETGGGIRLRF